MSLTNLASAERKIHSQNGEDGVIEAIFAVIGTTNRFFVEFGVQDATECNTAYLLDQGWTGLLMDGGGISHNPKAVVQREFITAENINGLLAKYQVPQQFDLLSIDIDGNDYWVWRALTYRPRVVVMEYNAGIPPDQRLAIAYDPHFVWTGSDYFGASLRALAELGKEHGYVLVHCERAGANAFFVEQSALPPDFVPPPLAALYRPPNYFYQGLRHPADAYRRMIDPLAPPPAAASLSSRGALTAESCDAEFNRLRDCRHGAMLYNANDSSIGRSLDLYGEFSEGEVDVFRQIVHPGDIVLDIGANIGAHTVFFAKATGPTGGVLAFEPQRLVFQVLCANMALNSLSHVWCFQQALGERPGSIFVPALDPRRLNDFGALELHDLAAPGAAGDRVPIIRMDSLGLPACRLIKIGVAGMETQALRGATGLIARFRPVLYVENDRPECSDELIRYIDTQRYDMFWHTAPLYNPENFLRNPDNVFGASISKHMLCMPRESGIAIDGPRVQVPGK